ncbi:SMAD/FHA domain-containing protein [Mucor lusitanicus]|uniref:SMAD/FHA domain-containing protein n=1 Tax=Mucor circinelloides f. lusitanicus TaxID=29924 RepID=A0A8H4BQG2_MUCCL|nr:SMAD/FHA domain-containing protein [Mucor lusitanicus]
MATTPTPTPSTAIEHKKVHIKLVPNVGMTNRCFVFDVVDRELESGGSVLKLGRYSDRTVVSDRLSFKSKVVSRYHAEIWLSDQDGKIYIRDSGSSSGTFVNHIRLAAANTESATPHQVVDGDLIQLGVDYKGGLEPMYRAVRMRLEVDRREWQEPASNTYNLAAFQQLKNQINTAAASTSAEEVQECCICLYCIAPFQALFIAPCSHIYHYRCLRPLLTQNYPGFSCPLCRTYSNLEASVAVEENEVLQMLGLSNLPTATTTNTTSEEDEDDLEEAPHNHNREKTILDEDTLEV